MARASTIGRVCIGAPQKQDGLCWSDEHKHAPNPEWWITEDGQPFKVGDRLWNYYDCEWGTVLSEPDPFDGWFEFQPENAQLGSYMRMTWGGWTGWTHLIGASPADLEVTQREAFSFVVGSSEMEHGR